MNSVTRVLHNPMLIVAHACRYWPFRCISDEAFLKMYYYTYHHEKLDLDKPEKFNAKLQWLKLYNRRPEFTMMADKYLVRDYVAQKIGKEHIVPLLGVWDKPEDIDFDKLPNQFVLKCNHDSGSVVICRDKSKLDKKAAINKLKKCLKKNQFWKGREYVYYNIDRKVIAEQYLEDDGSNELTDYKLFCFDGVPKFISTDKGRFSHHIRNYYTMDWEFIDASYGEPNDPQHIDPKPEKLAEMDRLARILSEGIPHVRVDFYIANDTVYFGELTFTHGGGAMDLQPVYYDELWGSYLQLPKEKIR